MYSLVQIFNLGRHPLPHVQPCFACSLLRLLLGSGTTSNEVGIGHPKQKCVRELTLQVKYVGESTSREASLHPYTRSAMDANVRRSPKRWKVRRVCRWLDLVEKFQASQVQHALLGRTVSH